MTDPRKLDPEAAALIAAPLTLQERMANYGRIFAAGIVGIVIVGTIAGALTPSSVRVAIGYTAVLTGAVMLLAGGVTGGGYANLGFGLVGRVVDWTRSSMDDTAPLPSGRRSAKFEVRTDDEPKRVDPMERLRKGLRPERNPAAFWTVVGGFIYIAVGSILVIT